MFTQHIPRTGNPVGKSHSVFTRVGAGIGTIALAAGFVLVSAPAANAAEVATSYAQGQFLSGTLLGSDLANVVELGPAEARNNGTQPLQTSDDPLDASVIQTVNIDSPDGIQADLGDFLNAGAVNQYAQADKNGVSLGASGAIGDDGAIGVGATQSGAAGDLTLDLNSLIDGGIDPLLTDLTLTLKAAAAQATGNLNTASGDYTLDGAVLSLTSPAIADLGGKVDTALGVVDSQIAELSTEDGALGLAVGDVLDPVLGVVGSSADVSITIDSDARTAVQSLLNGVYSSNGVNINLQTGEVQIDLAALQGGDLNNLPVNTELLSDEIINAVLTNITQTVSELADQLVDKVSVALHSANVGVHASLDLLSPQAADQVEECTDTQIPIIGDVLGSGSGGLGGLLGGLGGVTQGIIGYTTQTVCNLVDQVLPDLHSTVNVDIEGSVDGLINGSATTATANISLLDGTIKPSLDVTAIVGGIGDGLLDGLFDSDGAISRLTQALNIGLVKPAVDGLLGDNGVGFALTDLLSVRVNLQETSIASPMGNAVAATGSNFTQTAVRVSALNGAATVNVAAATVGPNITTVVPPCTTNCGPNPPCVTGCGGTTTTTTSQLAYTGVGIATLIAVILALLAAGAYLAREGYRRNHTKSLTSD
ncbi:hypothetical protein BH11ACT5_BH11ACT5_16830 [soil metagenome]